MLNARIDCTVHTVNCKGGEMSVGFSSTLKPDGEEQGDSTDFAFAALLFNTLNRRRLKFLCSLGGWWGNAKEALNLVGEALSGICVWIAL